MSLDLKLPKSIEIYAGKPLLVLKPAHPECCQSVLESLAASRSELEKTMEWASFTSTYQFKFQYERLSQSLSDYFLHKDYVFHIFKDGVFCGCIGLHKRAPNPKALELGYWIDSRHTGQGVCTQAAKALLYLAFEIWSLERVQIAYSKGNKVSQRVVEKLGCRCEGELQHYQQLNDSMLKAGLSTTTVINAFLRKDCLAQEWFAGMQAKLKFDFYPSA